jgi:hypothetical protein
MWGTLTFDFEVPERIQLDRRDCEVPERAAGVIARAVEWGGDEPHGGYIENSKGDDNCYRHPDDCVYNTLHDVLIKA